jgi:hypothetical protein
VDSSESIAAAGNEPSDDERIPARACSLSVNFLCLIGAMIGLGSIVMPWTWVEIGLWHADMTLLESILYSRADVRAAAGLVFAAGTILAFAFPLACGLQIAGLAWFYHSWAQHWFYNGTTGGLSIGFFVAVISCIVVVASVVWPTGPGCGSPRVRKPLRTQTAGWTHSEREQVDPPSSIAGPRIAGLARNTKQWVVALAAASLLVVLSVVAVGYAYGTPESLVEVEGGVMFVVGPVGHQLLGPCVWNGSELSVSDGTETVKWILLNESWEEHVGWMAVSFESKNLSGLVLTPTIVDWMLPGYVSAGDQIVLVVKWDPPSYGRFLEGITYTLCLNAEFTPPIRLLDAFAGEFIIIDGGFLIYYSPARGFQVDFEFEDRRLSSECWAINATGEPVPEMESDRAGIATGLFAGSAAIVAAYWFLMVRHRGGDHKNLTR